MARIFTYVEGRYSTVELDSGEYVMLSVAQTGIVIFRMWCYGLFPSKRLATWTLDTLEDFVCKFGGETDSGTPFRFSVNKIMEFDSIKSLERYLSS